MSATTGIRSALLVLGGLEMGFLMAPAGQAQVIHPDQIIGTPAPQAEMRLGNSAESTEAAPSDLEKGFDRQMMAPDAASSGGMDTNVLKTPDATDAENARDSDSQSSVSF